MRILNMQWPGMKVFAAVVAAGAIGCGNVRGGELDGGIDGPPPDAGGDAALPLQYDVGYINSFTLTPDVSSLFGFVAIVNTGTTPLRLATATVVSFSDDNSAIDWRFEKEVDSSTTLSPGRAGGFLTLLAKSKILVDDVVREQLSDEILTFSMRFTAPQPAGVSLLAQAVLEIEGIRVTLPISINVVAANEVQFNSARRVLARP